MVLAKSPTLQAAMKQPEVRYLPEILLIFPEYKKTSLAIFLQFLYTGEVGKCIIIWNEITSESRSSSL